MKLLAVAMALALGAQARAAEAPMPTIQDRRLIVDGQPFLVLGGELHNSSASSLAHLDKLWPRLQGVGVNTVIAPIEWDQTEPSEGHYDFAILDGMLQQARAHQVRLVLLWFGAWKNSMSSYAAGHVKHDQQRFPRAYDHTGRAQDILTPFSDQLLAADAAALKAVLAHLRQVDTERTVIMLQLENEIGMLPDARDHGPLADAAWQGEVPRALLDYLQAHRATLAPRVKELWQAHGARTAGSWPQVFGESVEAQEVFQAWFYARFVEALAWAGKQVYPIPMYVNAALNRPGKRPGEYPSGGPVPHLHDIWKAGAPSLDLLGVDIYFPDFVHWATSFARPDNPLFIPESHNAGRAEAGANAFYAIGELGAIGVSPFGVEDIADPANDSSAGAYAVLKQIAALIGTRPTHGFKPVVSYEGAVDATPRQVTMGGYALEVSFQNPWGANDDAKLAARGGLVMQLADDEFLVAGKGLVVSFHDAAAKASVGIDKLTEGSFVDGQWQEGRWLNGDESHQGRHLRLSWDKFEIQRIKLYKFH